MALSVTGREIQSSVFSGVDTINSPRQRLYGSELRSMNQINAVNSALKPLEYIFLYAPASFTHEGYGVNLNEIQRPYLSPLIDVVGGKARKASFQFVIVDRDDGFTTAIDDEIALVQQFADNGIPVNFNSVHKQLDESFWYIDNMNFTHQRSTLTGQTASAQCDISLTEYIPSVKKLIQLPRFKYGNITQTTKGSISAIPGPTVDHVAAAEKIAGVNG
jgi:hypothetical protein